MNKIILKIINILTISILIIGALHTFSSALNLYKCLSCSAPRHTALLLPGLIYVLCIFILLALYRSIKLHTNKKT